MAINSKILLAIPIIIFLLAAGYSAWAGYTGNLKLDIDLKGGTQIVFETSSQTDTRTIESALAEFGAKARSAKSISGFSTIIDVDASQDSEKIIEKLKASGYSSESFSTQTVGPTLGKSFFGQAQIVLIIAFILMAITIFIIFRQPGPSFFIVLSGLADIVEAFAISQILGIQLSLATFAALLLLIGYSVDTNILLTARVLKSEGEFSEKVRNARKTGLTMTAAAIGSMIALFLIGSSNVISQITSVLVLGLIADVMNTWLLNAGLLKMYLERRASA